MRSHHLFGTLLSVTNRLVAIQRNLTLALTNRVLDQGSTPVATADRILDAAIEEFVEHGLAGARVDRIAVRAGANKQLLYRHFGNKEGLFDAAVRAMVSRFDQIRRTLPDTVEARLPYYFERATDDQQWVRLLQWEALHTGDGPTVNEEERRAHMQRAVERVRADQVAGLLPDDLDAGQLFLSFQALAAHPSAFPQMTRFITGMKPTDPEFRAQRAEFLRRLGRYISARPAADTADGATAPTEGPEGRRR